jgi:hypothetical protein
VSKSSVVLCVALIASVAIMILLGRNLQRERARADSLAARLLELEPLEKSGGSTPTEADAKLERDAYATNGHAIEPATKQRTLTDAPEQPGPVKEYSGTLRARQQVERLQAALASGTPLQEYQIQPLIDAIDKARTSVEQEGAAGDVRGEAWNREAQAEANRRIVQLAADILFESQLEQLIELLHGELERSEQNP